MTSATDTCVPATTQIVTRGDTSIPNALEPSFTKVTLTRSSAGMTVTWHFAAPLVAAPTLAGVNYYVVIYPTQTSYAQISHQFDLGLEHIAGDPTQPATTHPTWDARTSGPLGAHQVSGLRIKGDTATIVYPNATVRGIPKAFSWTAEYDEGETLMGNANGALSTRQVVSFEGCPTPAGGYGSPDSPSLALFDWAQTQLRSFPPSATTSPSSAIPSAWGETPQGARSA